MSGCVTVTGPPASICALNFGTTDPFEASTLPNRTEISRIGGLRAGCDAEIVVERLAIHFGKALGQAEHRHRLDRLVGRDHHHRLGAGRERRIGDIDRAEDVGLDALAPVALEDRHMLERRGMEHDVRLELVHQPHDALAVADIGDPAFDDGAGALRRQRLGDGIERRLGILDHQQPRGAEGHDAVADLRADRAAAAGDDDRLALHQRFEPRIVDLLARPQQQILDRDRRQPRRIAALQRRQAADDQPEPARPHQHGFGMRFRLERRRRHHHARDRLVAPREIARSTSSMSSMPPSTGMLRIDWPRSASDGDSTPTGQIRLTAPLSMPRSSTSASAARPISSVGDGVLGPGVTAHARVAEIAIGKAQRAEEGYLEEPVEDDGDLAEEEGAVNVRRDENVVEHQQRQRQHRRDAQDVQRIRQRDEAPFRRGQIEDVADRPR